MNICKNCGVELEEGLEKCPLCGRSAGNGEEHLYESASHPSDIILIHKKEKQKYLWELAGIITFSGIVVCTIVDLLLKKGLSWSLYSDVSFLAAWIILTLIIYTFRRSHIFVPGLIITILATLFSMDLFIPGPDWFFPVGFPLTIVVFFSAGIAVILYKKAHFRGFNIIGATFLLLAGTGILTELILDEFIHGSPDLQWSLIAAVSLLPFSLIFLFYHYRLKKGNRLDSFFHI